MPLILIKNPYLFFFTGRVSTKIFEDAVAEAPVEEAPVVEAAPAYEASPALPFLPYPPNCKGYIGDVGFDPFRFSDFLPVDFLREAELKHGRICMLAICGFTAVDLGLRVYPTPEAYEGLTAITAHDAMVEYGAMGQLLLWIGVSEVFGSVALIQMLQGSGRQAGDFGVDGGFLKGASQEKEDDLKLKEITVSDKRPSRVRFAFLIVDAFYFLLTCLATLQSTARTSCHACL